MGDLTNCILVAYDVGNMYNNIDHTEGTRATHEQLERHRPHGVTPFNTSIIDLLEHVLQMNNFQFNDIKYLQMCGTATGTQLAARHSDIFMGYFEDKFVYEYPSLQCVTWLRFLDDTFCIWKGSEGSLDAFTEYLNSVHATIKFTVEKRQKSGEIFRHQDTCGEWQIMDGFVLLGDGQS